MLPLCILRPASLFQIMKAFLSESKYKNLLPLFVGNNILLVSPETKAKEMLRILKRVPEAVLLGKSSLECGSFALWELSPLSDQPV